MMKRDLALPAPPAGRVLLAGIGLGAALLLGACAKQTDGAASAPVAADAASPAGESAGIIGVANRPGSFLAYQHEVSIRLPAARIAGNLSAVHEACMAQRFGPCSVISEELGAGESPTGNLQVRAAPAAVAPLSRLAAAGGEIAQRSTSAEDLADAVRDNGLTRARLELQHAKLLELLARKDLKIEDMITLNEKLAEIESNLQSTEQEAAQQRRRLETNLVSFHFNSEDITAQSSRIGQSLRGLGSVWDNSVATLITVVGALLPFAIFAGLAAWVIGLIRRRRRPASTKE